jgi:hypothetical protein
MAIQHDGSIAVWGYNGQYTYQVKVNGKWVTKTGYHPSLISLAPTGTGFTSLGDGGWEWSGEGVGLAVHGP